MNACHNHNVRVKNCNFKIKFSRTTTKSECISVKGPKIWNGMPADIKLCKPMYRPTFKKNVQSFTFATLSIWLMLLFLLLCIDYLISVM